MNQDDKSRFENSAKNGTGGDSKREAIKLKLMEKYDISYEEAEEVLVKFENKRLKKFKESQNQSPETDGANPSEDNNSEKYSEHDAVDNGANADLPEQVSHREEDLKQEEDSSVGESTPDISKESFEEDSDKSKEDSDNGTDKVDSILSGIVPNYDQEVSIVVDHVELTFDLIDDRIDSIKESFIRTIKRNKSKKKKFKVLKDINFKIYKGEKIGIIGYNGAGKSTLLRVITGVYPPDSGEVKTYGNISPLLSLGAGFDYNYSGRRNIYLNGAVLGYDKQFLMDKEQDIIDFSELGKFIDYPIKNYSSGMLAKLGFSIATMLDPDILIVDEVLGVGDVNFRRKSADKIRSLMDGRTTVLLVSHSIPQIRKLCDKAIWIDKGEIREIGDVNDVCDHYLKDSEKASKEQLENIQFT